MPTTLRKRIHGPAERPASPVPAERRHHGRAAGGSRVRPQLRFLSSFLRQPLTVGSVWPSSTALSRVVVESCGLRPGDTVVELGPGTGAFTGMMLDHLDGDGRLVAVELNSSNAAVLRRRFPQCEVIEGSAEHLPRYVGRSAAHCAVSGLAWGNMSPRMQDRILRAILRSLAPSGRFVAFAYVHATWLPSSQRFRRSLLRYFDQVDMTRIVWRNLPPAFVYQCSRKPTQTRKRGGAPFGNAVA